MYRDNFNLGDESMDITLIFKVAGVGILISVLNMILTKVDKSEVESQERLIDLTVENLKKLTIESKEDIKNKGNLYKKLITFSGICIGIILI